MEFVLSSPSLRPNSIGKNLSPALEWHGAPEGTKSFAITVFDPDAPSNGGWRHWTVVNIPGQISSLGENASAQGKLPKEAIEIENDFGDTHYGGPCPPKGDKPHRYVFTIFALKTDKLNVVPDSDRVSVETSLKNNSLAKASFTVKYARQ